MCPGMRPATGWIAYFTSTPRASSSSASSRTAVLGLGDREAVARDHDDRRGVGELDRGVVHRRARGREPPAPARRADRALAAAEPADHDVQDGAVHGVGHELGQDRARGADEGAAR